MSKVRIKVAIENNDLKSEEIYNAIKLNKKLVYYEKNFKTTILFEPFEIIRENDDYLCNLKLKCNKVTENKYILKKENKIIMLNVLTDYIIIDTNLIKFRYKVLNTDHDVVIKINVNV